MKKLPPALLVGFALFLFHGVGNALIATTSSYYLGVRWVLAARGIDLVMHTLIAVGLLDLARTTRTRAMQLSGVLFAIAVASFWIRPVLEIAWGRGSWPVLGYAYTAAGMLLTASSLALVVAADGLRRAPVASVLALVAVLGYGWMPFVSEPFHLWLDEHRVVAAMYWLVQGVLFVVGTSGLARLVASDDAPDPRAAASGLRILESALKFRVVLAVAIAAVGLGMIQAWTQSKVFVVGAPLLVTATAVIGALGCLRLARAKLVPAMPVAIGAALLLWWSGVQLVQLSLGDAMTEFAEAWSLAGPLVAAAGLALVGTALSSFARARALDPLREAAGARTLIYGLLAASSVVIQNQAYKATTQDTLLVFMLIAASAGIGALLSFSGLAGLAADAIEKTGALPEARVVSTSPP